MKKTNTRQMKCKKCDVRRRIFHNKTKFHVSQAALPFPEKIEILVQLQRVAQNIKRTGLFVWRI